jgi:hypothetical protein
MYFIPYTSQRHLLILWHVSRFVSKSTVIFAAPHRVYVAILFSLRLWSYKLLYVTCLYCILFYVTECPQGCFWTSLYCRSLFNCFKSHLFPFRSLLVRTRHLNMVICFTSHLLKCVSVHYPHHILILLFSLNVGDVRWELIWTKWRAPRTTEFWVTYGENFNLNKVACSNNSQVAVEC